MVPNIPDNDEQLIAYLDQQIAALKISREAAQVVVSHCSTGLGALEKAPPATLANVGEVVGALAQGLRSLLEANMAANLTNLKETIRQLEKLEKTREQRTAKVHLGGFVPRARA